MVTNVQGTEAVSYYKKIIREGPSREEIKAQKEQIERQKEQLKMQAEQAKLQAEGIAEMYKIMGKCMRIALRIMTGDNVPREDDKLLMEHYPEIHRRAWEMRMVKEKPKDWESEVEDEDDEENTEYEIPDLDGGDFNMAVEALDISI